METISTVEENQPLQKSGLRSPYALLKKKIADYIVIGLIFVFFAIPFAGLSLHYHKFGVPPRFLGLVQFFWGW